jgi:hypothetical protein
MSSPASVSSISLESSTSTTSDPFSKTFDDVFQPLPMPPRTRSAGRNVHIYDARNPTAVFGGLILSNGVTNANLYSMLLIFTVFEGPFPQNQELFYLEFEDPSHLQGARRTRIEKNNHPLQPGKYYIVTMSRFLHHPFMIK